MKISFKLRHSPSFVSEAMAKVQVANVVADFVFWSLIFIIVAHVVTRRLGCLGITLGAGGAIFSALATLTVLLPGMEPTFFSLVPFPTLLSISSLSQQALLCMVAAICCFGASYVIERIVHQRKS